MSTGLSGPIGKVLRDAGIDPAVATVTQELVARQFLVAAGPTANGNHNLAGAATLLKQELSRHAIP